MVNENKDGDFFFSCGVGGQGDHYGEVSVMMTLAEVKWISLARCKRLQGCHCFDGFGRSSFFRNYISDKLWSCTPREVAFAIILLTKKVKDWYGLLFEICRKEIMATPWAELSDGWCYMLCLFLFSIHAKQFLIQENWENLQLGKMGFYQKLNILRSFSHLLIFTNFEYLFEIEDKF